VGGEGKAPLASAAEKEREWLEMVGREMRDFVRYGLIFGDHLSENESEIKARGER